MNTSHPKTWVEISRVALATNISALRFLLGTDTELCAVIKANAYGHDIKTIARLAGALGLRFFAVDNLDEALTVRSCLPEAEIIILGYALPEWADVIIEHRFIQTIYSEESLKNFSDTALRIGGQARLNLKIETGTHRQGIDLKKMWSFLRTIRQYEKTIEFTCVSSHFADAETPNSTYSAYQMELFAQARQLINEARLKPHYTHFACSASIILDPNTHFNLARAGIALYGIWPSEDVRRVNRVRQNAIDLQPVLTWKTYIAQIKELAPGECVGYGMTFRADRSLRIAVVPVGYSDGYRRIFSQRASVLVRGHVCLVIGTICMNMMMIDVSKVPTLKEGDIVTLLGRDGMHQISAEDLAGWGNTIAYEIVTQINPLLPRIIV